ncbi:MAG: formylglycine-generating enzyme family protein [Acidimicrobiia bacterium]
MSEQIWVDGGEFAMGSDEHYPDEAPQRRVKVDGFWMDSHTVTNAEFAAFVGETGHQTFAEKAPDPRFYPNAKPEDLVPGSLVFAMTQGRVDLGNFHNWWDWTHGADWRHPLGPGSTNEALDEHPVVHVAHSDAAAYAEWAGKSLPTEAEWEFAARGGLDGAEFVWGDDDTQDTDPRANTWQGSFPFENTQLDGWTRTSPVGSYEPNGYGLFDMAGNVWQWTDDWYEDRSKSPPEPSCCAPVNPRGGSQMGSLDVRQLDTPIPRKVVKGGSHLCTIQYCFRYRPAARQPQMIDTSTTHIGFRCVDRKRAPAA